MTTTLFIACAMALACSPRYASAQSQGLKERVKEYFLRTLDRKEKMTAEGKEGFMQNSPCLTDISERVKAKDIAAYRTLVWDAWREANGEMKEEKLIALGDLKEGKHGEWHLPATLEPDAVMPFYYGAKDSDGAALPLFIYLHGSGPKVGEWSTGLKLGNMFKDSPSAYFIPQIPNEGNYYRWWQLAKQYAWEKLLRQSLSCGSIDADRLYVFGISEGGYGSQRLASFYADYWAAAGPMAGGEPLKNAPVENCANIGFSFLTGADDMGFYRNILTHYTQSAFDSVQLARPLSADGKPLFRHRINLLPGMQHSIDYRLTTPWLKQFVRNPYPKTVMWEDFEMDGRHRSGFYNIQVLKRPSSGRTYYEMNIVGNTVTLTVRDVDYTTVQTDPQWGIEMKFVRSYRESHGGELRLFLNEHLVDMSKSVTVIVNGREVFRGKLSVDVKDIIDSCVEFFDPSRLYSASVVVRE